MMTSDRTHELFSGHLSNCSTGVEEAAGVMGARRAQWTFLSEIQPHMRELSGQV